MSVLLALLAAALVVSLGLGALARMPAGQIVAQTLAMFAAVLAMYGLVALL